MKAGFLGILALCVGSAAPIVLAQQRAATPAIRDVRPVVDDAYPGIARYAPTPATTIFRLRC